MSADRRIAAKKPNVEELCRLYAASLLPCKGRQRANQNESETEKGIIPLGHVCDVVFSALKSIESATELATNVHRGLSESSVALNVHNISEDTVELLDPEQASDVCRADRIRYLYISACASDVLQAIDELNSILSIVACILSLVIFGRHTTFHRWLILCTNDVQSCS
jgi:hypothetical protein